MPPLLFDLEGRIPATPEELAAALKGKTERELEEMLMAAAPGSVEERTLELVLDREYNNQRAIPANREEARRILEQG